MLLARMQGSAAISRAQIAPRYPGVGSDAITLSGGRYARIYHDFGQSGRHFVSARLQRDARPSLAILANVVLLSL